MIYKNFVKRMMDLLISFLVLIIILIPLVIITILLLIFNKGAGALFTQARIDENAKLMQIIKFKTMMYERDTHGILCADDVRMMRL